MQNLMCTKNLRYDRSQVSNDNINISILFDKNLFYKQPFISHTTTSSLNLLCTKKEERCMPQFLFTFQFSHTGLFVYNFKITYEIIEKGTSKQKL